ncbi:nucleotide exchange factor GrpE [Thermopolyspora sp. NPDC052614]|uniref:nucleotide exchange factor GrpE n=1 Tax=Thermopolyspora sp. NPDC052614 TaxID=3155682 RepID=UPI003439CB5C
MMWARLFGIVLLLACAVLTAGMSGVTAPTPKGSAPPASSPAASAQAVAPSKAPPPSPSRKKPSPLVTATGGKAGLEPQPTAASPTPTPTPTPDTGGGSAPWVITGVALALGLAAGAAAVIPAVRRRASWAPPRVATVPAAPPRPRTIERVPARPGGSSSRPERDHRALTAALREVAAGNVSQAVTQQIDRLLSGGDPGREALVSACIRYRDQLEDRHPALAARLLDALRAVGVHEVVADGQRFDARIHEAVDMIHTDDPSLDGRIAATEVRGYSDGDRVVRVPKVTVYRMDPR